MLLNFSYHYCLILTNSIFFFVFSILDIRYRKIPNILIILTLIIRILISIFYKMELSLIFSDWTIKIGVTIFFVYLYKKSLLGSADVKMIIIILCYFEEDVNQMLMVCFFVLSWIQLIIIKMKYKMTLYPLAPVFFIAYVLSILIFDILVFF